MTDDRVPTWPELIALMCFGEVEEEPFVGVLEIDRNYDGDRAGKLRVFKRQQYVRVEQMDGTPVVIRRPECSWNFGTSSAPPLFIDHENESVAFANSPGFDFLIGRPNVERWEGDDFSKPTAPAVRTTWLGREAWQIELAPPSHKPSPLVMTIDARTGMTLREQSVKFGLLGQYVELEVPADLDDALFTWDGPFRTTGQSLEENDEEFRLDMEQRRDWLTDNFVPSIRFTAEAGIHLHEWHDDGTFQASFSTHGSGYIVRRLHSDEPWHIDANYPQSRRWSDATWDWCLGADEDMSPEEFEQVRAEIMRAGER